MKSRCEIYSITLSYLTGLKSRCSIGKIFPIRHLIKPCLWLMGLTGLRNVPRGKSKVKSAIVSFYLAENNKLNDG